MVPRFLDLRTRGRSTEQHLVCIEGEGGGEGEGGERRGGQGGVGRRGEGGLGRRGEGQGGKERERKKGGGRGAGREEEIIN